MNKTELEREYDRIYRAIFLSDPSRPLSFVADDFGRPYVVIGHGYYDYLAQERGQIVYSERFQNADSLLFKIFYELTFERACDLERDQRLDDQSDYRQVIFAYQLALMERAGADWYEETKRRINAILSDFPIH